jgi:hypothetical protein
MLFNTRTLRLTNEGDVKRATVRRTFTSGASQEFDFRLNHNGGFTDVLFFAGHDTGTIELIRVAESPLEGSMDGWGEIDEITTPDQSDRPSTNALHNRSPRPVYVGVRIFNTGERFYSEMRYVIPKFGTVRTSGYLDPGIRYEWYAAELQMTSLYPPYWT